MPGFVESFAAEGSSFVIPTCYLDEKIVEPRPEKPSKQASR